MEDPGAESQADRSASSTGPSGVVVLGTSRSGTSAIARAFVLAGFFAGVDEQLLGPMPSNLMGHFEALSVLELNEEMLRRFDSSWWAQGPPAAVQRHHKTDYLPRIQRILDSLHSQAEGRPIVIKEPRISSLLPIWRSAIDRSLHVVLAVRSPIEVALSLFERDGTPFRHGLGAWEVHMTDLLDYLNGTEVTVAPFAQITKRPDSMVKVVEDSAAHFGPAYAEHVEPSRAGDGIERELPNQHDDGLYGELLSTRQKRVWEFLQSLSAGGCRLDVPAELCGSSVVARDLVRQEGDRLRAQAGLAYIATSLDGVVARIDALERQTGKTADLADDLSRVAKDARARAESAEARAESAETGLRQIQESRSWRVTAPLRRLGGARRDRRH